MKFQWLLCLQSKRPNSHTKYDTLPSDWKTTAHHYSYGWQVTKEILQRYLSTINSAHDSYEGEIGIASSTNSYLRRDTGLRHINYVPGKANEDAANCRVEQMKKELMFSFVLIGCTQSKWLFWCHPTPTHLQRLVEVFAEEPRWFEDFYAKEESDNELMHAASSIFRNLCD